MNIRDDSNTTEWHEEDKQKRELIPRGTVLGRYVIIEPLGAGGMGAVYRAYDPELNRGVALKILSVVQNDAQKADRAKNRLLREAQALAQLSHPNVVGVHDVGMFSDDVFIAMELVEGQTLHCWLEQEKRSLDDILQVMLEAGRGLSAAHKAGLIHRDFKPGNVMVGVDHRVRVLDFGLARAVDDAAEEKTKALEQSIGDLLLESRSTPSLLQSPLTLAGRILGTPMYMSPEQLLGYKTDERTDQFSFCAVLYEALFGQKPFQGGSIEELRRNVTQHVLTPLPKCHHVPGWVHELVLIGLQPQPNQRFESMDELLERLSLDPNVVLRNELAAKRRKRVLVGSIILVVLTLSGLLGARAIDRHRTKTACLYESQRIDRIWNDARVERITDAFQHANVAYAFDTWSRTRPQVDLFANEWKKQRYEFCLQGELSQTLGMNRLTRVRVCMDQALAMLRSLVGIWEQPDPLVIRTASLGARSMPDLDVCRNEKELNSWMFGSVEFGQPVESRVLLEQLAEVQAYQVSGQFSQALQLAQKLLTRADDLNLESLVIRAYLAIGAANEGLGFFTKAKTSLQEAFYRADAKADDRAAFFAASRLVSITGLHLGMHEAGSDWHWLAAMKYKRLRLDPKTAEYAALQSRMASVYRDQKKFDQALAAYRQALSVYEEVLGPSHPQVGLTLNEVGAVLCDLEQFDQAIPPYTKARLILERSLGPHHPMLVGAWLGLGQIYSAQAKLSQAMKSMKFVLQICADQTCKAKDRVEALFGLARLLAASDQHDPQSLVLAREAKKILSTHPRLTNELDIVHDWIAKKTSVRSSSEHK